MGGYDGLSKSIRAIECEDYGGMTATTTAKWLRKWFIGISAKEVKQIFTSNEWHHCSSAYNRVDYYYKNDILRTLKNSETREDLRELILQNKNNEKKEIQIFGKVEWKEFNYFQKKYYQKEFAGDLIKKGDWISFVFDGKKMKKNLLGKHCFLSIIQK